LVVTENKGNRRSLRDDKPKGQPQRQRQQQEQQQPQSPCGMTNQTDNRKGSVESGLGDDPVAVAWGLAGYEETCCSCASVDGLMLLAGGDLEAFAGLEDEVVVVDFEG
jgi:hypothetical protein